MNNEWKYWIALSFVYGIGDIKRNNLIARYDSAREIFQAPRKELLRIDGITEKNVSEIKGFKDWERVEQELAKIEKSGLNFITLNDPEYPESLKHIYNPPPFLYMSGSIEKKDDVSIAIVGTRVPDRYGRQVAENLAGELALRGVTIVSGLARGIDSIAQAEALKRGGRTIGVLGCGIDVVYPPENDKLYKAVAANGAVVSEFFLGTGPHPHNFPQRNRIISGLSLGVVVVQASEKSGSLITASFALDQNKDIFAVPGNIGRQLSKGTNRLIKRGAKLVETVDDILGEIEQMTLFGENFAPVKSKEEIMSGLTDKEKTIYAVFAEDPIHVDKIITETGLNSSSVLSVLLSLELDGRIKQLPGKMFQICL